MTPVCPGEILPVDQMEQRAAGMKSLALRNGNGNVSNTFGSSLPRLENEIERGNTNNLCIKLSLLLLEAPAASIRVFAEPLSCGKVFLQWAQLLLCNIPLALRVWHLFL